MKYKNFEIVILPSDPCDEEGEGFIWEIWGTIDGSYSCLDMCANIDGFEDRKDAIRDAQNTIDDPKWIKCFKQ